MTKLSDTAQIILSNAAQRPDRLAELPAKLPAAARNAVARSLVKQDLLEATEGDVLRITDAGFRALNLEPPQHATIAPEPRSGPQESVGANAAATDRADDAALYGPQNAAVGMSRPRLRDVALQVLSAWAQRDAQPGGLVSAMDQLHLAMAAKTVRSARAADTPRKPREGTKQQAVLALLRRPEGTNIAQIVAATSWAKHTVRGFLANLKRKGITVEVLERVRQVGAGSTGAKGSFRIYRIADAA